MVGKKNNDLISMLINTYCHTNPEEHSLGNFITTRVFHSSKHRVVSDVIGPVPANFCLVYGKSIVEWRRLGIWLRRHSRCSY